jgi:hypothetical protein
MVLKQRAGVLEFFGILALSNFSYHRGNPFLLSIEKMELKIYRFF